MILAERLSRAVANGIIQGGDPLLKKQPPQPDNGPEIKPSLNFEGLYDGSVTPPDPSGDSGLDLRHRLVVAVQEEPVSRHARTQGSPSCDHASKRE